MGIKIKNRQQRKIVNPGKLKGSNFITDIMYKPFIHSEMMIKLKLSQKHFSQLLL